LDVPEILAQVGSDALAKICCVRIHQALTVVGGVEAQSNEPCICKLSESRQHCLLRTGEARLPNAEMARRGSSLGAAACCCCCCRFNIDQRDTAACDGARVWDRFYHTVVCYRRRSTVPRRFGERKLASRERGRGRARARAPPRRRFRTDAPSMTFVKRLQQCPDCKNGAAPGGAPTCVGRSRPPRARPGRSGEAANSADSTPSWVHARAHRSPAWRGTLVSERG
jgi:hypothetical protein